MRRFLPLILLAACCQSAVAQKSPEEALKSFTVADGLQIELFASEPLFVNPTCIDVDHRGRVWVCESVNYRCDLRKVTRNRPEGDRIVVLEDTDGDGKADKSHTFYQEKDFLAPLGVAVAPLPDGRGSKVYVCHAPHIYVFEDNDGDLKADGPPKILLTGFRGIDHDHGVHGLHFGPDGKLYFSVGDQGVQNLTSSNGDIKTDKGTRGQEDKGRTWTSNSTDCRAGTIWRCNPDGTNLELLAHNFRNPYEPAVDSFGTIFTSDNDDDGNQQTRICYVMPGGNYGYHPRGKGESHWHEEQPGVVHKVLRTGFGSPTGLCWYEGEMLRSALGSRLSAIGQNQKPDRGQPTADGRQPTAVYGLLLHTDAGPREVRCYVVKTKGAGYELDQINLVTSTDNWFRPSDVCVAPDGTIFVSDWYDPGVGGHGMGDTTRGRVYRITAKGEKGYKVPVVDVFERTGQVQALRSPNLAARQLAFNAIVMNGDCDFLYREKRDDRPTLLRARASWLISMMRQLGIAPFSEPAFQAEFFRQNVLNNREKLRLHDDFKELYPLLAPSGRREFLISLQYETADRAKEYVLPIAKLYHGQDPFYLAAISIAVGNDPKRREIILADFEKHFPEWNDKVAKLVWELRPPQVIAKLDQKLVDPKLTAAQKGQILDILAVSEGIEPGLAMLRIVNQSAIAELRDKALLNLRTFLPGRWRALRDRPEFKEALHRLLAQPQTRIAAIELIGVAGLPRMPEQLYDLADDDGQPIEVRLAAVRAMGAYKSGPCSSKLKGYIANMFLAADGIGSLGRHAAKASSPADPALQALVWVLTDDRRPNHLHHQAVEALASSRPGTIWLLDTHAKKELPEALLPEVGRLLRNSPYQDLRNRALIAFPAPGKIDPKKIPSIASLLKQNGDAASGKAVLVKNKDLGCIRCHTVRGQGGQIGPDLSMIGKKASRENLFESILQPDKAVADQFIRWIVATADGVTLEGLIVEETGEHVILRDADGKDTKVPKSDITGRKKSSHSLMPTDLLAHMTEQDLVDMVVYLETLKTPALSVDSWHILGPFDNGSGDEGLDKVFPAEKSLLDKAIEARRASEGTAAPFAGASGLDGEYDGKHGKVKWRTVRTNGEGYVDLAALFAPQNSQIVSYLWKDIESPVEQDATILIGTDDGCKLWINGEEVLSHRRHEAATPERDKVPVKLRQGRNTILLKINNGDGPHGFYFSVLSEQELKGR